MEGELRIEYMCITELRRALRNYKDHDIGNLHRSMKRFGFTLPMLLDERTGRLVAGHGRLETLLQMQARRMEAPKNIKVEGGRWYAPVIRGLSFDSDEEAEAYLIADNRLVLIGGQDDQVFAEMLADLAAYNGAEALDGIGVDADDIDNLLKNLGKGLDEAADKLLADGVEGEEEEDERTEPLRKRDVPDTIFPTNNEWGIPLLDKRRQADAVDMPVLTWGAIARSKKHNGTYHFYTDDERFNTVWDNPAQVVNSGCLNVVEPNYTCSPQMPAAAALWQIYKKRWLARYWQSQGIRIFVDMNVPEPHVELNMLGVPKGWKAYATHGCSHAPEETLKEWERACNQAETDDILFVVYGGGKQTERLCGEHGFYWIGEHMDRAKGKYVEKGGTWEPKVIDEEATEDTA